MSGLRKITSLKDIENLVELDPVEVSPHITHRSEEHNAKISDSLRKFNESDEGKKLREQRSKRMREFYESPKGQSIKRKLSKKCGRPKQKALSKDVRQRIAKEYKSGTKIKVLAEQYDVSRASIYRYIREFTKAR